jgi:hypothetical protein
MNSSHLSAEALSTYLDGESGDTTAWAGLGASTSRQAATHLVSCSDCQARLAALRKVAEAVGAPPVPPSPVTRARAVGRALAALEAPAAKGGAGAGLGLGEERASPVGLAGDHRPPAALDEAGGPARGGIAAVSQIRDRRRPQRARWLAGAAAALAAGGLAAGLSLGIASGGSMPAAAPSASVGAVSGNPARARRVASATHRSPARSGQATKAAGTSSTSSTSNHAMATSGTARAQDFGNLGQVRGSGALTRRLARILDHRVSRTGAKPSQPGLEPAFPPPRSALPACSSVGLPGHAQGWTLAYWGRVTYRHTPAEVLVYAPAGTAGRAGRLFRAEVVSRPQCHLLLLSSLSR